MQLIIDPPGTNYAAVKANNSIMKDAELKLFKSLYTFEKYNFECFKNIFFTDDIDVWFI